MAERISIPYYRIETNTTPPTRGELRPNDAGGSLRSRLISYDPVWNDERLFVRATYAIDNVPSSTGCLTISQQYEFTQVGVDAPCEPGENIPCQKYRALVTYNYTGNTAANFSVNVAQRNHFTVNGISKNSVGLFRDCDTPVFPCLLSGGIIFKDKKNPLFNEYLAPVITNGQDAQIWDNVHQTFQSRVTEPVEIGNPYLLSGCPECMHTHWRWAKNIPNSDHFGGGNLLLPAGTTQDLSIGIVRYHPGEERPNTFVDLLNITNPEPIRSKIPAGVDLRNVDHYKRSVPEDVVYWLLAKGKKESEEFFGYYSFFNPASPNAVRPIVRSSQQAESSQQPTVQDEPTSITYAHLFEDGDITYTEIDPNTIAQPPAGYAAYNPVSYDIRTEAEASGPNTVTFNLPSVSSQPTFNNLRVLHSEPDPYDSSQAIWVDRTILPPDAPAPDFANRKLYAKVNHVGPFMIATYTALPPNTNVADLTVAISDSPDPVTAGNQLTYTITVTNNGPNAGTDVILTNGLSPDVVFDSVNSPQGTCREEESTVMCKLGTLASSASVNVTVVVTPYEGQTRFPSAGKALSNTAFVTANEGDPNEENNSDTESTNALPNPNAPPSVTVQSPGSDTIFYSPAAFTVIVGATDTGGSISQVEVFKDGESVGNGILVEAGKYSVNLTNVSYGEHSLIAVATDNGGRKAVSDTVSFFVNGPILVDLDSPTDDAIFGRPASITLTATAANPSGTISQVEFLADGLPVGNGVLSGTDQYTFEWSNASTGVHVLRAIATDGNGLKSHSYATRIKVTNLPSVNITNPINGAWYPAQSNITFTANASDFDGYISKVEFLFEGELFATATLTQGNTYSFESNPFLAGTRSITARATDADGLTAISVPVNFAVSNSAHPVDLAVWRPSNGTWYVYGESGITEASWGLNGDVPVPGDYDGDGKTDFSVFRPSNNRWYIIYIIYSSNSYFFDFEFGLNGDKTAQADYDGDGKTDAAVFRPFENKWYIQGSSVGFYTQIWGLSGDIPASADYDGDRKADTTIWRPSEQKFYSINSSDQSFQTILIGQSGEPVSADYDGDGKADYAIFDSAPSIAKWHIRSSLIGTVTASDWGLPGDKPVQNDYDGDGRVDIAVWRNSSGRWYIKHASGTFREQEWGLPNDIPVPSFYRR